MKCDPKRTDRWFDLFVKRTILPSLAAEFDLGLECVLLDSKLARNGRCVHMCWPEIELLPHPGAISPLPFSALSVYESAWNWLGLGTDFISV